LLLRISLLIIFFISALFSDVKIFASHAVNKNGSFELENPIIFYKNSIIQAKKGFITKKRKIILEGKVFLVKDNNVVISASKLIAYTSRNITFSDIFFYDKKFDGWIEAKQSKIKNNLLKFKRLYFSTCCIKNPDWYLRALNGTYNKKDKSLKLYHLVLIINKVPVLYLPYFYLSFDKTRRSGFIRPYIGYSNTEGILYSQPLYIVTSINTDLEITPTIRTKRGKGIYSVFRFVDSNSSKGYIKLGKFVDFNSYYKKYNLANKIHYGYNLNYQRNKIFFKKDALYVDLKYANDVDYFYLDAYNYRFDTVYLTNKIITSQINYISPFDNSLYGIYAKYFIDTSKINNDDTWQILPQFNYHHFINKKYNIINSIDMNIYNYKRKIGSNFVKADISIPVSLYYSLLNDYLKLKITESLNSGYGYYYQTKSKKSKYLNLSTLVKVYTSLTKDSNITHIITPSLIFNIKNYSNSHIYTDLINIPEIQNYIHFNLFQILENNNFILSHTLNETYYLETKKYSDLENQINLTLYNYTFNENNKYSFQNKRVTYNSFKISYNNESYYLFLSHIYQADISKALTVGGSYNINIYKKIYTKYNYDLKNKYWKYWLLGVKLNKKCWKYDFSIKQARIPVLENSGISYRKDNIISLNVNFNPFGGINQTFVFKGKK